MFIKFIEQIDNIIIMELIVHCFQEMLIIFAIRSSVNDLLAINMFTSYRSNSALLIYLLILLLSSIYSSAVSFGYHFTLLLNGFKYNNLILLCIFV